jgi:multicomponent Na+:H+ antiporter subunit E
MIYLPGLALALAALWFALSGHVEPLFLGFGAFSVLASLWLSARFAVIDRDASPWHRTSRLLLHAGWLAVEVVKANITVIGAILSPKLRLQPGMVRAPVSGRTDLAKTIFANSITLTPGTVTVDVEPNGQVLVHALDTERSTTRSFEPMDRRAARAGDGKA